MTVSYSTQTIASPVTAKPLVGWNGVRRVVVPNHRLRCVGSEVKLGRLMRMEQNRAADLYRAHLLVADWLRLQWRRRSQWRLQQRTDQPPFVVALLPPSLLRGDRALNDAVRRRVIQ